MQFVANVLVSVDDENGYAVLGPFPSVQEAENHILELLDDTTWVSRIVDKFDKVYFCLDNGHTYIRRVKLIDDNGNVVSEKGKS
jgi:hypothetical protein